MDIPVGTKHGCFTVIAGPDDYRQAVLQTIDCNQALLPREEFIRYVDNIVLYKVRCSCGKEYYIREEHLLRKKWRYCDTAFRYQYDMLNLCQTQLENFCGLRKLNYGIGFGDIYDMEIGSDTHASLRFVERLADVDDVYYVRNRRVSTRYKSYKCRCDICGKDMIVRSDKLRIFYDRWFDDKSKSYKQGYHSVLSCDCHTPSAFEWAAMLVFKKYGLRYCVEVSFPDLLGIHGYPLRYDFAILDANNHVLHLIECQGEQHYRVIPDFGGIESYDKQWLHDNLKREYAQCHNFSLCEIPEQYKHPDKLELFLFECGVISTIIDEKCW